MTPSTTRATAREATFMVLSFLRSVPPLPEEPRPPRIRPPGVSTTEMRRPRARLELGQLVRDGPIALQPHHPPGESCEPGLVEGPAAHLQAARIVSGGPLEKRDVRRVQRPSGPDRLAIAGDLPSPQAGQADSCRHHQED